MTSVSSATSTASTTAASASSSSTKGSASTDISKIDWNSIIEASVQAKLAKADSIDVKITGNEAKVSAYQNLQSLLAALKTSAQALRAPTGTLARTDDVFLQRAAFFTANGSVDASSSVSVTTESGAQTGGHDLKILQLAKAHKVAGSTVASASTNLGHAGVISLGTVGGGSADITITSDMTLNEVAEAINNQASTTGVKASVLKVADAQYELVLTASETGRTISASEVSGDDVLNALGVTSADGGFADELQASKRAIVEVDGVEITRSSNDISDIFDGMTFHLYQTTPADTSITIDVGTDLSSAKTAVQSFVDAYNAVRQATAAQQAMSADGTASSDAVLFGDGTLRNISQSIYTALNTSIDDRSMADIGLSFNSSNNLVLDESKLDNALLDNLDAVKSLFTFQMTSSSSDLLLLTRGTSAPASFTIDVTVDGSGNLAMASVGGDSSLFTVSGNRIIGKTGTAYEGYSFVYAGNTSQSIDVSVSSGIAEQIYDVANDAADASDGTLQALMDNLTKADGDLQRRSDDIKSRAESFRTTLTARYAKFQAAIEAAQSTKSYLEALLQLQTSSS